MRDAGALRSEPAGRSTPAVSGRPLAADLLALRELQASLGLEETDLGVVRIGTNAIVEILAIDCGIALVDATATRPEIRFGWCQGRAMPQAEIEALLRALERDLQDVRRGRVPSLHYGGAAASSPDVAGPVRALGLNSLLLLGLGSGGRRTGALLLASREPDSFTGEPMILAELLASEMSEHTQRVRREAERGRSADDPDVKRLRARNAELEAQAGVAAAASLSHDAERQIDLTLRKALELTGHRAGAIHLVETNDAGDDLLCVARALGDPDWVDQARQPRWRRGEGLLGKIWDRREGVVFGDLKEDEDGFAREALERAGYHRGCAEPLVASGRVFGVLQMYGEGARPYDDSERGMLRAIARQAATAIHNARLLGDLTRHSLELEWEVDRLRGGDARLASDRRGLADLLAAAAAAHDGESRAAAALARLLEASGADAGAILLLERGGRALRLMAQKGFPDAAANALWSLDAEDAVIVRGLEATESESVLDLADTRLLEGIWARRAGYRYVLVHGCRAGGELRGVLLVATRYRDFLGEEKRRSLGPYSDLMAILLDGAHHAAPPVREQQMLEVSEETPADHPGAPSVSASAPSVSRTAAASAAGSGSARSADRAAPSGEEPASPSAGQLIEAQRMESLGRLASGIAHDFNNSLGAIMGHASHIKSLVPDYNPVHGKAAVIEEQSQRAADLVRRMVTFAHGSTGHRETLDVNALVEETVAMLLRSLDPSVVLESRCAPGLPPVEADPGQIRQALLNLAVNARDALPQGGRIIFETRGGHLDHRVDGKGQTLPAGDYVSIAVSDNGVGMSQDVADQAFEPFFTTKAVAQGSGLGLTVVQDIVQEHGGHVALSSAVGIGTSVRLYLPATASADPAAESAANAAKADESDAAPTSIPPALVTTGPMEVVLDLTSMDIPPIPPPEGLASNPALQTRPLYSTDHVARILVVDDEPVLREMTVEMLKSRGYEVLMAKDGVEALDIYRQEWGKIDLVVLDMIMPRLGGIETFRRLIGMDRKARILLCSGLSHNQQALDAVRDGAIGLLPKPFGMNELLGWVDRALRK
ncbi:MAG TPA: GAF domain-containing protein [Verrucomicrobiae bacterium]|nr:GAF domain-containing protein [Verrucomicrobiae bacterium]